MKRSGNTRIKRAVLLLCLMMVWGICPDVRAQEAVWKEYRETAAEGKLSYDPKSVVTEDSVVDVWSRFEPAADGRIREMKHWVRFDCARKRMKLLKTITVYRDGSMVELPQKNKFEAIEPGSNPAVLGALVCGDKYEPPAVSQEPVTPPVEKPSQEILPTTAPSGTAPQEVTAPAEKPVAEVPPAAAPVPKAPLEPVSTPVEQPLPESQAPVVQPRQNTPPAETPPAAPAVLPQ